MNKFDQALQDIHDINRSSKQSVLLQGLQAGLLAQMSANLHSIHDEIAQAQQMQAEALAVQQELLRRDTLQGGLEELIYQGQKLVVECSKSNTDLQSDARFFLLDGLLKDIDENRITT